MNALQTDLNETGFSLKSHKLLTFNLGGCEIIRRINSEISTQVNALEKKKQGMEGKKMKRARFVCLRQQAGQTESI